MTQPIAGGNTVPTAPFVDTKTGILHWSGMKWCMDVQTRIQSAIDLVGQFIGIISAEAKVENRTEGIGTTLQRITSTGQLASLTDVAADVNLDHVADTVSYARTSPQAVSGATVAYHSMVASSPSSGNGLLWNGSAWMPSSVSYSDLTGTPTLPANTPSSPSHWINAYDSATGVFSQTQPAYSDLTGTPTGLTVVIVTAALTGLGSQGSMTFTNGILTAQTPAT